MKLKKAVAIAVSAGALAAISVPAMAFENEFHGMYRAYGFMTNAFSGGGGFNLAPDSRTDKYIEQRARLQYIAKASDDLKLVTHFELDTKFGGAHTASKYLEQDAGNLDADKITLETKSVYLDFKIPSTTINTKVGIQPWRDAMMDTYALADITGALFTGKFGAATATYGYFTVGNSDGAAVTPTFATNDRTRDLNVLDLKFALTKDITLGTSYYMLLAKTAGANTPTMVNNTVGLNAAAKFGPAALNAAVAMQFGKAQSSAVTIGNKTTTAFCAAIDAKVAVGPGKVGLSALYLSGDKSPNDNNNHSWQSLGTGVNYFIPADMWLITRNIATINTSTAIGATSDLTRGGKGIMGVFAGYNGTAGKVFYGGNVGWARVAERQTADSASIGTEINATVGYKLYDNMSASLIGAYAFLGDGYGKDTGNLLATGVHGADNPFMTAIALNYSF